MDNEDGVFDEILSQAKLLRLAGHYQEALGVLSALQSRRALSNQVKRVLALEKADNLFGRGFVRKAETILNKAIKVSTLALEGPGLTAELENLTHALLQARKALVAVFSRGNFREALRVQAIVRCKYLSFEQASTYQEITAAIEVTCTKVLLIANALQWPLTMEEADLVKSTSRRLQDIILKLISLKKFLSASSLAYTYLQQADPGSDDPATVLEVLTTSPDVPLSIAVSNLLALAKHANNKHLYDVCDSYLSKAEQLFPQYGQVTHQLELRLIQLQRPSPDIPIQLTKLMELYNQYAAIRDRRTQLEILDIIAKIGFECKGEAAHNIANETLGLSTRICYQVGSRLLWVKQQLALLAGLNMQSGHFGKALEAGALVNSPMLRGLPSFQYLFCAVLGNAYERLGSAQQAGHWMGRALEYALSTGSEDIISVARENHLRVRGLVDGMQDEDIHARVEDLRKEYVKAINSDLDNALVERYVQKILNFVLLTFKDKFFLDNARRDLLSKARIVAEKESENGNISLRLSVMEVEANLLMRENAYAQARELFLDSLQTFATNNMRLQHATATAQVGLTEVALWKEDKTKFDLLDDALGRFSAAFQTFQHLSAWDSAANCQVNKAHVWDLARGVVTGTHARNEFTTNLVSCLAIAEKMRDELRRELSILPGLESVRMKRALIAVEMHQRIYQRAILALSSESRFHECWDWVQKFKARSLSDLLGMGCMIPGSLSQKLTETPEVNELLQQESVLVQELSQRRPERRLVDRIALENLYRQLSQFPIFEELAALREGRSEKIQELNWLFQNKEGLKITIVDWICLEQMVFLVILNDTLVPYVELLPVSADKISSWISSNLSSQHRRTNLSLPEKQSPLRELDQLIYPISQQTTPDSLLILSPSGPLHSIPLHALQLQDGTLLIERNPLVYCPSLSVLRQCIRRAGQRNNKKSVVAFGVFDEGPEADSIRQALESYAQRFGGQFSFGKSVTSQLFRRQVENASWIHFHGHVSRVEGDILEQGLELCCDGEKGLSGKLGKLRKQMKEISLGTGVSQSGKSKIRRSAKGRGPETQLAGALEFAPNDDGESDVDDDFSYIEDDPIDIFTVRDVFSLNLGAPVVSLIACESAHQEIAPGDEPLGLVSAFLYAGATSVMGTLWPIQSSDGRSFSNEIFQQIQDQYPQESVVMEKGRMDNEFINLALAIQRTVLNLRQNRETQDPYHWAAFCLYGAWEVHRFDDGQAHL